MVNTLPSENTKSPIHAYKPVHLTHVDLTLPYINKWTLQILIERLLTF